MQIITLYWKNKDEDIRYFYANIKVLSGNKTCSIISHPALAQNFDEILQASPDSIRKYCGKASYEHMQRNVAVYVIPAVRELLTDLANNKGPISIDKMVVPDFSED